MKTLKLAIILFLFAALSSCQNSPSPKTLKPVNVQLAWKHQAQFAGLYAAEQLGYFADEGIQVTFLPGGPDIDKFAGFLNGEVQFGQVSAAELIDQRVQGRQITAIAAINRLNPAVFFSKAELGIKNPEQFAGKTIRVTNDSIPILKAMLEKAGVYEGTYQMVITPSDVELFATGDIPIWSGFSSSLLISVQNAGFDLNIIYPDDYGIHFYSDVLITTDELIAADPELVEGFTRAALKGWTYAIEHPDEMPPMVRSFNPDADLAMEGQRMKATIPLVNTGVDEIGWMNGEIWEGMTEILFHQGVISADVDPDSLYTMMFLDKIYK